MPCPPSRPELDERKPAAAAGFGFDAKDGRAPLDRRGVHLQIALKREATAARAGKLLVFVKRWIMSVWVFHEPVVLLLRV